MPSPSHLGLQVFSETLVLKITTLPPSCLRPFYNDSLFLLFSCRRFLSSRCVSGPAVTTRVFLTSYLISPHLVRPCHVSPRAGTLRTSALHSRYLLHSRRPWRCLWALAIWTATPLGWAPPACTWAPRPSGLGLLAAHALRDLASTIHFVAVGTETLTRLH